MKMDLEVVFTELGQFGRYQTWQYALLTIPLIASAFEEMSYIFTSSEVDYRCFIPECEWPNTTDFLPSWLPNTVPYDGDPPEPKWCERYASRDSHNNSCSKDNFLDNVTETCDQWVFATKERTSATEFKLLCEDNVFKRTMVGTVNNFGLITNYVIICYLSDRFGRKTMLLLLTLTQGLLVLAQSFAPTYSSFISLEYLVCFCSTFNTSFILAIEIVGGDKRIFANCLMNTLYSLGEVIVALIMWWVQDFRILLRVIAGIKLANLLYMWMVTESIHWYMTKEYYEKVVSTVKNIAQCNKKEISESTQHALNLLLAREEKAKQSETKQQTRSVIRELLKSPALLVRFGICSLTWLVNVFVYFGFSLMSVTLAGNKYFNFILMALVEVPAYALMWIGMEFFNIGRKTTLVGTCFLAAVPCFIYLFVPSDADITRLCLFLLGKFAITISYTVIYEVGAEVFPTELRQSMVGLCCAVACLGGLFAPQIPLMAMYMNPMMLFFWLSVGAGCLSLMLPETQGRSLPDTIMQAIKLT
ncbi:organic cation transporter protein-like isoform X1 [Macrosteles quadrilineatus]|uniref:organic cation transporter protein-like isoform X1 n=1 Tax=Macrosteles quadrilineatus TaxID=74068 RepID=UPI0023E091E3|nr:organic cation transporter protein-like isoform X1 [Macrosteles quadrilineatus]